jgi:hypothetical protein
MEIPVNSKKLQKGEKIEGKNPLRLLYAFKYILELI